MKKEKISTMFDEFLHTNVSQRPNTAVEREMQSPVKKELAPEMGFNQNLAPLSY